MKGFIMLQSEALDLVKTMATFPGWWLEAKVSDTPDQIDVSVLFHGQNSRFSGQGEAPRHTFRTPPEPICVGDVDQVGLARRLTALVVAVFTHEIREFTQIWDQGVLVRIFDPHSDAGWDNWTATADLVPGDLERRDTPGYAMMPELLTPFAAEALGACPGLRPPAE